MSFDGIHSVNNGASANVFGQAYRRVQQYDANLSKGASAYYSTPEYNLTTEWLKRTGRWGGRVIAGQLGDTFIENHAQPFGQKISKLASYVEKPLASMAQNNISYAKLSGVLPWRQIHIGHPDSFKTFKEFWSKEGFKTLKETSQYNYKISKQQMKAATALTDFTTARKNYSAKTFFKNTLLGANADSLSVAIEEKKWGTLLGRFLGFGIFGWNIGSKTLDAYRYNKAKEGDGTHSRLTTLKETLKAFTGVAFKSAIAWEMDAVGLMIGRALLPVVFASGPLAGFSLGTITGIALGALLAVGSYKLLSYIISDPPKQKH